MAGIDRNRRPLSSGLGGRIHRNTHPTNFTPGAGQKAWKEFEAGVDTPILKRVKGAEPDIDHGVHYAYITSSAQEGQLMKAMTNQMKGVKISHEQTIQAMKNLNLPIKDFEKMAKEIEDLPQRVMAMTVATKGKLQELMGLAEVLKSGDATPQQWAEFAVLKDLNFSLLDSVGRARSGAGRLLNSLGIDVSGYSKGLLKGEALEDFLKAGGGRKQLLDLAEKLTNPYFKTMKKATKLLDKPKWMKWNEAARELYTMSILSGPATHVVNTISNAGMFIMRSAEKTAVGAYNGAKVGFKKGQSAEWEGLKHDLIGNAVGLKNALSLGIRQTDGWMNAMPALKAGNVMEALGHLKAGLSQATDASHLPGKGGFWKVLKNGVSELDVARKEEYIRHAFSSDALGVDNTIGAHAIDYLASTLRFFSSKPMMGTDEVFKTMFYQGALHKKAVMEAVDAGINFSKKAINPATGKTELQEFMEATIAKGFTEGEYRGVMKEVRKNVFQGSLGPRFDSLNHFLQAPGMWTLFPFVRTPANIVGEFIERTPFLGYVKPSVREAFAEGGAARQEIIAKWCAGATLYGSAVMLAQENVIQGRGPQNPALRKTWLEAGNVPYSFKVGNKTVRFDRLDPIGMFFGMVADSNDILTNKHGEDAEHIFGAVTAAIVNNISSKTYTKGISDIMEILSQPDTAAPDVLAQVLSGFVPSILNSFDNAFLEDYKKNQKVFASSWDYLDAAAARTPWLSASVEPTLNRWGYPTQQNEEDGIMGSFMSMLDPFTKEINEDPVLQEMARLGIPTREPRRKEGEYELTKAEHTQLKREIGHGVRVRGKTQREAIEALISDPDYEIMSENNADGYKGEKQLRIEAIIADFHHEGRKKMLTNPAYPHLLDALKEHETTKILRRRRQNQ